MLKLNNLASPKISLVWVPRQSNRTLNSV